MRLNVTVPLALALPFDCIFQYTSIFLPKKTDRQMFNKRENIATNSFSEKETIIYLKLLSTVNVSTITNQTNRIG